MEQNKALKEALQNLSVYVKTTIPHKAKHFFPTEEGYSGNIIESNQKDFTYTSWEQIDEEGNYGERTHSLERDVQAHLESLIYSCTSEYRISIFDIDDSKKNQRREAIIIDQVNDTFNDKVLADVKFLSKYRTEFLEKIRKYSDISVEADNSNVTPKNPTHNPLNVNRNNFPIVKIKKLYKLLTDGANPFIAAEEEEFVNAFSGKDVTIIVKLFTTFSNGARHISASDTLYSVVKVWLLSPLKN